MNTKLSLCPTYTYHSHAAMVAATSAASTEHCTCKAAKARTLLVAGLSLLAVAMTGRAIPHLATRHIFKSKYWRTYTVCSGLQITADCHARPHAVDAVCFNITSIVFAICSPCLTTKCVTRVYAVGATIPTKVVTTARFRTTIAKMWWTTTAGS